MPPETAYRRLTERFAKIATIRECSGFLGWDAAVMMPPGGGATRGVGLEQGSGDDAVERRRGRPRAGRGAAA